MVDDAGPEAELAAQRGVREIDSATLCDSSQQGRVEAVQLLFGLLAIPTVTEANRTQFSERHQFQLALFLDCVR